MNTAFTINGLNGMCCPFRGLLEEYEKWRTGEYYDKMLPSEDEVTYLETYLYYA